MATNSKIEWTDATWNPVRGCTKISPGCTRCYAERFAERFRGVKGHAFEQGFDLRLIPEKLSAPLHWKKPQRIFVNSMSDLFHDGLPLEYIRQVFRVMNQADWHQYQVLTKRAERLAALAEELEFAPHIWTGVSVENSDYLWRVDYLRRVKAPIKFLSIEPLLAPLGKVNLQGINWVIVGGESGPGARPMNEDWITDIRDQCQAAGVAFFFKQWGGVQKKRSGRTLEGRTWDEMPQLPERVDVMFKVSRRSFDDVDQTA
jgi:protein gp37